MDRTSLSLTAACLTLLLSSCGDSRLVTEGPPPKKPSVRVTAPLYQVLSLGAKQYKIDKNSIREETLTKQFFLTAEDGGSIDIVLEDGFDGLAVDLLTTTEEPITVELFLDGKLHDKVQSTSIGRLRMTAGNTTDSEEMAIDVRLDAEEKKWVQTILDAIQSGDESATEALLSTDEELIQVDSRMLAEMMRVALKRYGGGIKNSHSERWSKLSAGESNAMNYRLPLEFNDGTIFFMDLIIHSEKLVAVRLKDEAFEKDWWIEAAYGKTYTDHSRQVITFLIEKKYAEAFALFGPHLTKTSSIDQMKGYRERFAQVPETGIEKITLLETRDTLVKDEFGRGAKQYFLVRFGGDATDLKVEVNCEFATGVTWKTGEIIGLEFKPQ